MKKISIRDKIAVENLNQTYGFPLPKSKARLFIKYNRPQTYEGSISVLVSGWITDENKIKHPFNGALVKTLGVNFKDVSKDLTNSLEVANEKAGSPIADVYDFVLTKIIPSVPYDAMDDFFKGIRNRKTKKKVVPKEKEKTQEEKIPTKWPRKTPVLINVDSMKKNDDALFLEINSKYPEFENSPHGAVYDDAGDKTTVVFPNKEYSIIPKKYLKIGNSAQFLSDEEKTSQAALAHYEELKQEGLINPQILQDIDVNLAKSMIDYKNRNKIPLDEIDKKFESGELPKKQNWIKKLFDNKRK